MVAYRQVLWRFRIFSLWCEIRITNSINKAKKLKYAVCSAIHSFAPHLGHGLRLDAWARTVTAEQDSFGYLLLAFGALMVLGT